MGTITQFILPDDYKCFVETGTGYCSSLRVLADKYHRGYSIELSPNLAERAKALNLRGVTIINKDSYSGLLEVLPLVEEDCVFWLDAHYPADYEMNSSDPDIILPLRKELELISTRVGKYKDLILIDDLRIYEIGPYQSGNLPNTHLFGGGLDFLTELFPNHKIERFYNDEGYISVQNK